MDDSKYTRCLQFLELDNFGEQCEHALGMNLLIYWTLDPTCGGAVCNYISLHFNTSPQPMHIPHGSWYWGTPEIPSRPVYSV